MADIKLKNGDGIEITYTGVNTMAMKDANSEGHVIFVNADDDTAIANDLLVGKTAHTSTGPIVGTIATWVGEKNALTAESTAMQTNTMYTSTNPVYIRPRAVKKNS